MANEIVTLLYAGFSDGAMARWRTLHEIAVITLFLRDAGEETAERYVEHEVVEARRAARDYVACQSRLGYEPMNQSELEEMERDYHDAIGRFSPSFGEDYGWAALVLEKKKPSFRDIEQHASLDHLRAHYRMASHNVHANPKGVFFKLGLLAEEDVLLTGPSDVGLADPGSATAVSLVLATLPLLNLQPTIDELVVMSLLERLSGEVKISFAGASQLSN